MLHLAGYDVTMEDLQAFRQLGSRTPGHPEVHVTDGIELTTGPLGQGISNAVGLAIAQAHLAATYNKADFPVVDNYTYVFLGDGCLQEGVASEACSLAGHLELGNLIAIYDVRPALSSPSPSCTRELLLLTLYPPSRPPRPPGQPHHD